MRKLMFASLVAGFSTMAFNAAQAVEIEYWQYIFKTRVKAMDKLIANFEAANPDITVKSNRPHSLTMIIRPALLLPKWPAKPLMSCSFSMAGSTNS